MEGEAVPLPLLQVNRVEGHFGDIWNFIQLQDGAVLSLSNYLKKHQIVDSSTSFPNQFTQDNTQQRMKRSCSNIITRFVGIQKKFQTCTQIPDCRTFLLMMSLWRQCFASTVKC